MIQQIYRFGLLSLLVLAVSLPGNTANPLAVALEIGEGESAIYILYRDGFIQTGGTALFQGEVTGIKAVDLTITPTWKGYYVLDEEGVVYPFGDAVTITNPFPDSRNKAVDMELLSDGSSSYFLREDGSIVFAGKAVHYGELEKDGAVDLEMAIDRLGYYVLYEDGSLAFFGSAINYGFSTTVGSDAVDLEVTHAGYFVTYEDGTVLHYGDSGPLPLILSLSASVTDMAMTSRGYRLLTSDGKVKSFLSQENQGTISWFAEVGPRTNRIMVDPTPTPRLDDSYFEFGEDGFTARIIGRLPEGKAIPEVLTTGQAAVSTDRLFVAVADQGSNEARSIIDYDLGEAASSTNTGALFVSIVAERGGAEIKGLSYSKAGLFVLVSDDGGVLIFLIEGMFEDSSVDFFMTQ